MRVGSQLAGRYRLERSLGRGGFGEVWSAEDLLRDRSVAIKFLYREVVSTGPVWLSKFRQEARIAVRLNHPGIVAVDDFGEYEGQWYLVMEFLECKDLAQEAAGHPEGLDLDRLRTLGVQIIEALAAAHEHGIVHRDLKPGNLLLLPGDRIKICDFGIAHIAEAATTHSLTGRQVGTPAYMAPEQWLGRQVDHRTDLYAFGGILYTLLTGRPPFQGASVTALMGQHLNLEPAPPSLLRPEVPRHLDRLVLSLLSKDPSHRPSVPLILDGLAPSAASPPRPAAGQAPAPPGPPVPGTGGPLGPTARELAEAGDEKRLSGDISGARALYEQVLRTGHPDHSPGAMAGLGILEHAQRNTDAARHWCLQAIGSGHPDHSPRAMFNLGVLEQGQGNTDAARHWYLQAIGSGHPDHSPRAMSNLGVLEYRKGNTDAARHWFRQAVDSGDESVAESAKKHLSLLG